jgi:hypothetical protein
MDSAIITAIIGGIAAGGFYYFSMTSLDRLAMRLADKALERFSQWLLKTTDEKDAGKLPKKCAH